MTLQPTVRSDDGCALDSPLRRSKVASLVAYLPDSLLRLRLRSATSARVVGEFVAGTLLFADISGFTALSEQLAKVGREGAEELTSRLNEYFEAMVDVIASHGGDVLQFGGDSLLVLFADNPSSTPPSSNGSAKSTALCEQAAMQAICCGLQMQNTMQRFERVQTKCGAFRLSMRIALHRGELLLGGAGSGAAHAQQMFVGPTMRRLAEIESLARPGEVLVTAEVSQVLEHKVNWSEERGGCFVVSPTMSGAATELSPKIANGHTSQLDRVDQVTVTWDLLGTYLIPAIYRRIVEDPGAASQPGEHRYIVTMFVHFSGMAEMFRTLGPHDALEILGLYDQYLSAVGQVIERHGGSLARVSADARGERLLVFFGAPVAVENPEQQALACALAMNRRLESFREKLPIRIEQRIAITAGNAFCGNVGSPSRREYTVIGDHVNAACRLMSIASPGDIFVSGSVRKKANESFCFQQRDSVTLRGIERPFEVYELLEQRNRRVPARSADETLFGRDAELNRLHQIAAEVAAGYGQVVLLSGEAGVGKTRLLRQLMADCKGFAMTELLGQCDNYGSSIAYLPWTQVLRDLLGFDGHQSGELSAERLIAKLATANEELKTQDSLVEWAPLLAAVLGVAIPDNQHTSPLTSPQRKEKLFGIWMDLLRGKAAQSPLLVVLEDAQWIDGLSRELLAHVTSTIDNLPILVIVAHRSDFDLAECAAQPNAHCIDVLPFAERSTVELLQALLGSSSVPEQLVRIVQEKTRGNPLFVEETVRALLDAGHLVRDESAQGYLLADERAAAELPSTVQNLILSRVDQLSEEPRRVIQIASMFGRSFHHDPLRAVLHFHTQPGRLESTLHEMTELELIVEDRSQPRPSHAFRHALVQEVIYESVAYARRREIHGAIGEELERTYGEDSPAHCEELARHFDQAQAREKALTYTLMAGKKAQAVSANTAAADYFESALTHMDALAPLHAGTTQRTELLQDLGEVQSLCGHYSKALLRYQECLDSIDDPIRRAHLEGKMGGVAYRQGQPTLGIEHLERGLQQLGIRVPKTRTQVHASLAWQILVQTAHTLLPGVFVRERSRNSAATKAAIEVYESLSRICYESDLKRTLDVHLRQLNLCESMPDSAEMAQTYSSHGIVCGTIPWFQRAIKYQHRGISIRAAQNNRWGVAQSSNFMGISYYWMARYTESTTCLEKSAEIFRDVGDRWETQVTYLILAFVKIRQGELQVALQHARTCLELGRRADDAQGVGWALGALAEIHSRQGKLQEALEYGQRAIASSEKAHDHMYLAVIRRVLAEIHLRLGNAARAVEEARASLKLIKQYRLPHEYVMGAFSTMAEACLAARASGVSVEDDLPTLRQIKKLCRQGVRKGRKFRNWLGYAYRISALCQWSAGRRRSALRLFQLSIAACTAIGARYDLAMTYCELGRCLLKTGDPAYGVCLEESRRLFSQCGAMHDLARVETFLSEVPPPEVVGGGSALMPHLFLRRLVLSRPSAN